MGTLCPYLPSLSPLAFGHLPLTRGVGPVIAKARMAQVTGFCSITAAAECPVTFGSCFYQLEVRLWSWWVSSCAVGGQRAGGGTRPYRETASGAAPTDRAKRQYDRGRSPHPPRIHSAPVPIPSGPSGHLPLIKGVSPSPTGFKQTFQFWVGEPLGAPAGNCASQESSLIRHASRATFPLGGGRLDGRPRCAAPTGRTKRQRNRDRSPHPPQCAHWGTFPQGKAILHRERWLGSPGAVLEPQRSYILQT